MKRLSSLFAALLLLSSCEQSPDELNRVDSVVTFSSSIAPSTRVKSDLFEISDQIYVTAFAGSEIYANQVSYTYDGTTFSSSSPISLPEESGLSYIAAYPADDEFAENFTFEILEDQSLNDNYEMSDLLIASHESTDESCPTLSFNHVLSSLVINITNADLLGGKLKVFAQNEAQIDIANQAYTAQGEVVELTPVTVDDACYKVIIAPQSISAGAVVATYSLDDKVYTWSANSNFELASGYRNTFNWDISEDDVTFDGSTLEWDDERESGYLDLSYFSATKYPTTIDTWKIIDTTATTADFAGLSAAIEALANSGRRISLEFPNLTSIPDYAIFGTSSYDDDTKAAFAASALFSVSAESATSIGQYAFYSCNSLAVVDFPAVTTISTFAFYDCTALTSIVFPSVKTLANHVFNSCTSIASAEFPEITTINIYVFFQCSSLKELSIATNDGVVLSYIDRIAFNWATTDSVTVSNINITVGSANYDLVSGNTLYVGTCDFTFTSITVIGYVTPEDDPVEGSVAPAEAEVDGKRWVVVSALTDEFDTWDSTKWSKSTWNYGVPVQMIEDNAGVDDGNLWIKATLDEDAADNEDRWFQSCRVMSKTQVTFPMYTECRIKASDLSAYTTYWLNNGDSNDRDEIDICEHNANPSYAPDVADRPYTMYSQYFIAEDGVEERADANFDNRDLSTDNPAYSKKWSEEFQILGLWWKDKNNLQFYINGEEAGSITTTSDFTRSLNIIWDLWTVDETWSGGIASKDDLSNDDINTMYVDWICTYTLVDSEE